MNYIQTLIMYNIYNYLLYNSLLSAHIHLCSYDLTRWSLFIFFEIGYLCLKDLQKLTRFICVS